MRINGAVFHQSVCMRECDLRPPNAACPICGALNRSFIGVLQHKPRIDLLACENCAAVSASRIPSDEALARYYATYYKSPLMLKATQNVTFDHSRRFGRHLASRYIQYGSAANRVSVLDYGGGDGSLAWAVAEALFESFESDAVTADITVIDYTADVVPYWHDHIAIRKLSNLKPISKQFDLIIASAIIEHLPEPAPVLQHLFSLMKPGGLFYARTPCVVPFLKLFKAIGIHWDFTYPAHIHDLGQTFWKQFFARHEPETGVRLVESRPSIVETSFKKHFLRTLLAYVLKCPWPATGKYHRFVGGWEVFARKIPFGSS